jgi:putative resolvase
MKLSEWARRNGVHYQTAYRWFRSGTLPVPARKLATGTILVDVARAASAAGGVALYARVSAHDQRADLDRQLGRLAAWAAGQGLAVTQTVAEVGSGVNGNRPKLRRLLADPAVTAIVVEHRDRLARFGVEHVQAALSAHGRQVLIVDPGATSDAISDDLVRDMVEALTSFCARLYGPRGARNRALRAVTVVKQPPGRRAAERPVAGGGGR